MIQGLYTSLAGMMPRINQQRSITNNLANQTTYGYKKTNLFLRELVTAQYALDHALGVERTEVPEDALIDFMQGPFDRTDMPSDVALNGTGFFRVQDTDGAIYYTRNGRFYLDPAGIMANARGMMLLNDLGQPVQLQGGDITIMGDGAILEDGVWRDTIGVVDFNPNDYQVLQNIGGGLFLRPAQVLEAPRNPDTMIVQGFLEESNVEPILAMVEMIDAFRMFELGQRAIQIQDATLQRIVSEVGVVR
ncbi:flagellar hook-basal body protein [Candidatus Latescibacterota bacterium]